MFWDVFGVIAGLIVSAGFIPQIARGFKTKKLDDLSYYMMIFLIIGMGLWLLYGLHIGSFPVIFANLIGMFLNGVLILMKFIYSKRIS